MENTNVNPTPAPNAAPNSDDETTCLVFGILSIVLCESGVLGLIFAILAKTKSKKLMEYGPLSDQAKAGDITGTIGLVLSIIALAGAVIAIIITIIGTVISIGGAAIAGSSVFSEIMNEVASSL